MATLSSGKISGLIHAIVVLAPAVLFTNALGNNPPTCSTLAVASTSYTIFTPQYFNNTSPLQYYLLRGCTARTIDSVNVQILKGGNTDLELSLVLAGGTPNSFTVDVHYWVYNHSFQYMYSSSPITTNPKLAIAANSNITVSNPGLDRCIACVVLAKTTAQAAVGDTVLLKVNFISGTQTYPVTVESIIRVSSPIKNVGRIKNLTAPEGLFLPEFLGRRMRVNPHGLRLEAEAPPTH